MTYWDGRHVTSLETVRLLGSRREDCGRVSRLTSSDGALTYGGDS